MTKYLLRAFLLFSLLFSHGLADDRPNILLIMCDDVGYSDIGCYGGEIKTPNLDKLAENGLRYTQFYNTSRCSATRAALLTGLFQHQTGIGFHVTSPKGGDAWVGDLNFKCVTIAEALKPNGYSSYISGKWHVTYIDDKRNPSKHNWPLQRGFDRFFGTIHGAGSFYDPNSLTIDNEYIVPHQDFYYTDEISDHMVKFIKEHDQSKPFFAYVPYTAAHWPLHALPEDISKYEGRYNAGWDAIREERYARMKKMGLIKPEWKLSEPYPDQPWDSLSAEEKAFHVRCMEVYAAMIDNMDQGIGRMVDALKQTKQFDNTLIFFLHDNGAAAEPYGFGKNLNMDAREKGIMWEPMGPDELQYDMEPKKARDGRPMRVGKGVMPGPADTYIGYSRNWGNASNTPFRHHKHWSHEGGISTPLIVHWPKGIERKHHGQYRETPGYLIDIMATVIDVSDSTYPSTYDGRSIHPMEGVSLAPTFDGGALQRETLYFEHEGNRAVRHGKWKLVSKHNDWGAYWDRYAEIPLHEWELFDMEVDRTETNNLANEHPEKVIELAEMWLNWAKRVGAVPRAEQRFVPREEREFRNKAAKRSS